MLKPPSGKVVSDDRPTSPNRKLATHASNLHRVCVDSDSSDCFGVSISARSNRNSADIISHPKLAAVAAFFMLDIRLYCMH
jgi:hypothetical protein